VKMRGLQHVSSPYPPGQQDAVRAFYGKMLGLVEIRPPRSLEHMQLIWFSAGAHSRELHFFPGVSDPEHPRHFCLEIEDVEAARGELSAAGYEPYDDVPIPTRPRFFCRDPFGNLIEFTTILEALE
jgi:catechol 2,3-dioxygenase-like lactoylglutathione lyase family enzyme